MKAIPYFLVVGALVLGTACSSTSTGTSATAGTGGSTEPGTYSSMGGTASGTNSTGMGAAAPGAVGSTDASGTTSGTAAGSSGSNASGTTSGSMSGATGGASTSGSAAGMGSSGAGGDMSMSGTSGTAMAADQTAFMGTFATMQDPVFLMNAASSNMLEIKAGQMASQKATNPEVRKYAQMMVSHHTTATQELKAVATPLGTKLPQTMMPVHQAMADRLANKTGKDFDEAYMDMMETAHKMDIAMFEVKSKAADKPQVQAFATKTLPMLRTHHTMADNIEKKAD